MKSHGFTLVELLVVIGVIGILFSGALVAINPLAQIQKGRDATRKSDLRQIQSALEFYRSDSRSYPTALPACTTAFFLGTTIYIQKVPCDPGGGNYNYIPSPPFCDNITTFCTSYTLYACLENKNDIQREFDDGNLNDRCLTPGATDGRVGYVITSP